MDWKQLVYGMMGLGKMPEAGSSDYETAMADMKQDAQEHLQSWINKYPSADTRGTAKKFPGFLSTGTTAPAYEMALYNRPQAFPRISSITNFKRREA